MNNQPGHRVQPFALFKLWLLYIVLGAVIGYVVYMLGGEAGLRLGIAVFAILAAIGSIVVLAALVDVVRKSRTDRE